MVKLGHIINRFTMGEVSPLLAGRVDLAKYPASCKTMLNFIPLLQGPVRRRGGTRFIAQSGNGDQPVALIDFAFSETTTYIVELGDKYARFFYQGAPVMDGAEIYQIETPWSQDDIFRPDGLCALKWVQSGDVMYLVCPTCPPQKLMRYGHTDWRIEALPNWAYDEDADESEAEARPNPTAIALWRERLVLGAGQTLYMSQSGAFENFRLSSRVIPGAVLTVIAGGYPATIDETAGTVTYYSGASIVAVASFQPGEAVFSQAGNVITVAPTDAKRGLSRIDFGGLYAGWTIKTNPLVGELVVQGVIKLAVDPNKSTISADPAVDANLGYIVRGSDVPVAADDPIEIGVYSEQMDRIEWLVPSDGLLVGTSGGEFIVGETTNVDPLGPENIKVSPETNFGSAPIQALRVGSVVFFVQRAGRRVRQFVYAFADDNYDAADVTAAAEHITRGGLMAMAWQSEPVETLWSVRPDGQLIGFSFSREQELSAWHRHQLGGGGAVSHLAVIPAAQGGLDEIWLSVKREVAGETVYYIERMEEGWDIGGGGDQAEAFFVDSGLTVRGAQMTEVVGLAHLEGHEVAILGDGGVQPPRVVTGGKIDLQYPADVVQVGLPYESVVTTVNFEAQMQDGTAQTRIKRFTKVYLRLVESGGGAVVAMSGGQYGLEYRGGSGRMDKAVDLFTGDKGFDWPGGYETDGIITVRQDFPLPFVLAAIIPDVVLEGKN